MVPTRDIGVRQMKRELVADAVVNELDRLGVSTNQDAYSGLLTDYQSLSVEGEPGIVVIKIYDDQASGLYNGEAVLEALKSHSTANLIPDDSKNIWNLIREFEL